jgi:hypothetical protein
MSNTEDAVPITAYLHDHVWEYHVPGGGYDVERMAAEVAAHFGMAPGRLVALRAIAGQVAAAHCPQCGAAVQAGGRECFCCGWTPG